MRSALLNTIIQNINNLNIIVQLFFFYFFFERLIVQLLKVVYRGYKIHWAIEKTSFGTLVQTAARQFLIRRS